MPVISLNINNGIVAARGEPIIKNSTLGKKSKLRKLSTGQICLKHVPRWRNVIDVFKNVQCMKRVEG